jgi:hypothetical protein
MASSCIKASWEKAKTIKWIPAKPFSHHTNFGCSKFFISMDREECVFKSGMQMERGYIEAPSGRHSWELKKDWDWHLLMAQLEEDPQFQKMLVRLMKKGRVPSEAGQLDEPLEF